VDYRELIFSEEFTAYRKEQIAVVVSHIHGLIKDGMGGSAKPDELRGVLEMAAKIIRLPADLVRGDKYIEQLNKTITEDLVNISSFLVRTYLEEIK